MFRDDENGDELTDALNGLVKAVREMVDEVIRDNWWKRGDDPPEWGHNRDSA